MKLELDVAAWVLLSAILHALWNALTKSSEDRVLTLATVVGTCVLVGGLASFFVAPLEREVWPYLAASTVTHFLYQLFLLQAYRFGDLSHVYPIARGTAPLLVALLAAWFAQEVPTGRQALGIALAALAMMSFALEPRGGRAGVGHSIVAAFISAGMIGLYTFLDGQGARHAGSPFSYIAWNLLVTGVPYCLYAGLTRRAQLVSFLRRDGVRGLSGGLFAVLGYAIVLWAMSRGSLANVAALRETSVVFAALIGSFALGEGNAARRVIAALVVALGVTLLQCG